MLCALISPDPAKQRWLHLAGMVPLLQRLTLQRSLDTLGDGNLPALMAEPSALGLQRQSARMLALLASDPAAQPAISRSAWVSSNANAFPAWMHNAIPFPAAFIATDAGPASLRPCCHVLQDWGAQQLIPRSNVPYHPMPCCIAGQSQTTQALTCYAMHSLLNLLLKLSQCCGPASHFLRRLDKRHCFQSWTRHALPCCTVS